MYKLEEKKRAVELYIKSGKKVGPVIYALGYTSPNRLRDWYKELCETGVLLVYSNFDKSYLFTQAFYYLRFIWPFINHIEAIYFCA